jgi:ubiquinone/menaquinone biosynthesis C-methylase UbiE
MSEARLFSGSIPANYDRLLGPYLFEPYALDLKERLKGGQAKAVLEIACGTGRVTRHLVEILSEGGRITATDINSDMIAHAKTKVNDSRVEWQEADAQELPFDDDTFDHVVCQFGVMFFPDKLKAFKEAYRVLTKKGKFVFNTWASLDDNRRSAVVQDVLDEFLKEESSDFFKKAPFSFYDTNLIRQLLTDAGFKDISIEPVKKVVEYKSHDEAITGFLDGTPLTTFLQKKGDAVREVLKQKLMDASYREFGDSLTSHMLAYVCAAMKE